LIQPTTATLSATYNTVHRVYLHIYKTNNIVYIVGLHIMLLQILVAYDP